MPYIITMFNACIWQFDCAYLLQVLPLIMNYRLKTEELSLNPDAPYDCLTLPHCSIKVFEGICIYNIPVPTLFVELVHRSKTMIP